MPTKKKFVLVTTEHRGVFAGYVNGTWKPEDTVIELTEAQMCVYWSADIGGVLGLAASGPSKQCRISPAVPKMTLQAVTSVTECTDVAVEAWKGRPWSR